MPLWHNSMEHGAHASLRMPRQQRSGHKQAHQKHQDDQTTSNTPITWLAESCSCCRVRAPPGNTQLQLLPQGVPHELRHISRVLPGDKRLAHLEGLRRPRQEARPQGTKAPTSQKRKPLGKDGRSTAFNFEAPGSVIWHGLPAAHCCCRDHTSATNQHHASRTQGFCHPQKDHMVPQQNPCFGRAG